MLYRAPRELNRSKNEAGLTFLEAAKRRRRQGLALPPSLLQQLPEQGHPATSPEYLLTTNTCHQHVSLPGPALYNMLIRIPFKVDFDRKNIKSLACYFYNLWKPLCPLQVESNFVHLWHVQDVLLTLNDNFEKKSCMYIKNFSYVVFIKNNI